MAITTNAGGPSNRTIIGLSLLLVAALLLTIGGGLYHYRLQANDEGHIRLTNEALVLAERVGALGFEAVHANPKLLREQQTFTGFQQAIADLETRLERLAAGSASLPGVSEALAPQLESARVTWVSARQAAQEILGAKGMIPTARAYQERLQTLFVAIGESLQSLLDELQEGRASSAQIGQVLRLRIALDRMAEQTHALFGGTASPDTPQRLTEALRTYRNGLSNLAEGNQGQGIRAIASASPEREILGRLQAQGDEMTEPVSYIADNGAQLRAANAAAASLVGQIKVLKNELSALLEGLRNAAGSRLFQPELVLVAAFVAMVLMVMLLVVMVQRMRQYIRNERQQNEAQKQQNDRNQQAILRLLDEMNVLGEGDLSVQATVTEDITGAIADSVNYVIEALRELVTTINNTAESVARAAAESEDNAARLIKASGQQTQQINQATQSIHTMVRSIEQVSDNAQRSSKVAQQSVQIATKGGNAVRRTIDGMNVIREQIQETSKRIKRLGESSQEIGNIVELINDIAEQTNILALNAAIQASSAGEAGRGFAVVADEVQRLAERSASATKQIEALVRTIQADTNEAVGSMEKSTAGVVQGAKLAEDAGNALDEIERVSNQIASLVQSISDAARQQTAQASEVAGNMKAIQDITEQTAAGTSATGEAIGRLAKLAAKLRRSVAGFKLP